MNYSQITSKCLKYCHCSRRLVLYLLMRIGMVPFFTSWTKLSIELSLFQAFSIWDITEPNNNSSICHSCCFEAKCIQMCKVSVTKDQQSAKRWQYKAWNTHSNSTTAKDDTLYKTLYSTNIRCFILWVTTLRSWQTWQHYSTCGFLSVIKLNLTRIQIISGMKRLCQSTNILQVKVIICLLIITQFWVP